MPVYSVIRSPFVAMARVAYFSNWQRNICFFMEVINSTKNARSLFPHNFLLIKFAWLFGGSTQTAHLASEILMLGWLYSLLKADLLRFNSFEVDQKSVLIHPRFLSSGRADIFVHVLRSNALSKPGIKAKISKPKPDFNRCRLQHGSEIILACNILIISQHW